MLLLGAGAIGGHIATVARAIGLHVVALRRSAAREGDPAHETHPPSALASLLPRADWLVIACPLTPETRGIIDAGALSLLPAGAHLVNIGRGEVVDQPAMIDALASGRLAGAYLDVFDPEPLPPESPLWDMPSVIVSPHDAASAAGNDRLVFELFRENLGRWQAGQVLASRRTRRNASRRIAAMRVGLQWARMSVSTKARPSLEAAAAREIAGTRSSQQCRPFTTASAPAGPLWVRTIKAWRGKPTCSNQRWKVGSGPAAQAPPTRR
jgi:hypothetical protein